MGLAKQIISVFLAYCCVLGCAKSDKSKKYQGALASSVGKINDLYVVLSQESWRTMVGDSIRKYFGAEVPGLPQEEPLFSMRQLPAKAFSGFTQKVRIFLELKKGSPPRFNILKNTYANPQLGVQLIADTDTQFCSLIGKHADFWITEFKKVETLEKQRQIKKSLERIPQIQKKLGFTVQIPSAYRIASEKEHFFWIRKDIPHGNMNLVIYEVPLHTIQKDSNTVASIIRMRDSVGAIQIPTAASGKFITEKAYTPYLYETQLDHLFAYETKGTWEIKDRYMAGPFVNYTIEDIKNNRFVILEGFVFAPSAYKRDRMFELEAIIKTIRFTGT